MGTMVPTKYTLPYAASVSSKLNTCAIIEEKN